MEILMTCAGLAQPSPRLVCMCRSARLYGVGVVKGAMLLDTSGRISIFFVLSYVCDYGLPCHCIICLIKQDKHQAQYISRTPDTLISIVSRRGRFDLKKLEQLLCLKSVSEMY